jgi:hypothetical protein
MPTTRNDGGREIEALRRQYLEGLDSLKTKYHQARQALDDAAAALIQVRDHIEEGGLVSDFADILDPKSIRAPISTSLDELERTRHHVQRLLFRILEAEGQRKSDIARSWGISRQLVSRMIHEPDK